MRDTAWVPAGAGPTLLAHRGLRRGADAGRENGLAAVEEAVAAGHGIETDLRRDALGRFYVSHDAGTWSPATCARRHAALWRRARGPIALNLKEAGHEAALVAFLHEEDLRSRVFLFDLELLDGGSGMIADRLHRIDPGVPLAVRVSDRGEPVARALRQTAADVVWLDEFDGPWATREDVTRLSLAGFRVCAVSPDLHGGSLEASRRRWDAFVRWGVDAICTDFVDDLAARLAVAAPRSQPPRAEVRTGRAAVIAA